MMKSATIANGIVVPVGTKPTAPLRPCVQCGTYTARLVRCARCAGRGK